MIIEKVSRNRMANVSNSAQGEHLKVLTVCSAGILRSPTTAHILSSAPFNFNTRCAGIIKEYALIHADSALVQWADEIICMTTEHGNYINMIQQQLANEYLYTFKPVHILDVEDDFDYRDVVLVEILTRKLKEIYNEF